MAEYEDKLLDHDYDGIKELDNDLPRWWLYLFWFTIVWGILYMLYFHVLGIGYGSADEYRREMDPNYVRHSASDTKVLGLLPEYHSPLFSIQGDATPWREAQGEESQPFVEVSRESDTTSYAALTDPADIEQGRMVFTRNCVQCHGHQGEGGIGPNLTDDYWLHGAGMTKVVKSIKYGYPAKGMISWRGFLKDDQILRVATFVLTLRGSNPPNGKAPQGELVTEYPD